MRPLASAATADGGVLAGTRKALVLPDGTELPWHEIHDASWDADAGVLTVSGAATLTFDLDSPTRLLQLVRERITHSVVLRRRLGRTTFVVRRTDAGDLLISHDGDDADPVVQTHLAQLRAEVGA